jgi:Antitoxin VbhA
MIAEQEQIERRAALKNALASQLIEGLEPDATVIEDAEKWARGQMTIAAAVANYKARVRHDTA